MVSGSFDTGLNSTGEPSVLSSSSSLACRLRRGRNPWSRRILLVPQRVDRLPRRLVCGVNLLRAQVFRQRPLVVARFLQLLPFAQVLPRRIHPYPVHRSPVADVLVILLVCLLVVGKRSVKVSALLRRLPFLVEPLRGLAALGVLGRHAHRVVLRLEPHRQRPGHNQNERQKEKGSARGSRETCAIHRTPLRPAGDSATRPVPSSAVADPRTCDAIDSGANAFSWNAED